MKLIDINIAKKSLVVEYPSGNGFSFSEFNDNSKGIKKFIETRTQDDLHWFLEATGTYSSLIDYMLSSFAIRFSLVNSKQIKEFAKMILSVTKTDKLDAKLFSM